LSDQKVKAMLIDPRKRQVDRGVDINDELSEVLYRNSKGEISQIENVTTYRYLGAIIDNRLKFNSWCDHIAKEVKNRTSFITRLAKTVKMNRKTLETFYNGYVRGYINYGIETWSSARPSLKEKIFRADREGLRSTCGALNRTSNAELLEESNINPLENRIRKSLLRKARKYLTYEDLISFGNKLRAPNLRAETILQNIKATWVEAGLPLTKPEIMSDGNKQRYNQLMTEYTKPIAQFKYRKDFWQERLLARCRMNVLPTKQWAFSIRIDPDETCRHCNLETESIRHLFFECSVLQQILTNKLDTMGWNLAWDEIRQHLKSKNSRKRAVLEKCLIEHAKVNEIFKIV
jgi:hypothetical protein